MSGHLLKDFAIEGARRLVFDVAPKIVEKAVKEAPKVAENVAKNVAKIPAETHKAVHNTVSAVEKTAVAVEKTTKKVVHEAGYAVEDVADTMHDTLLNTTEGVIGKRLPYESRTESSCRSFFIASPNSYAGRKKARRKKERKEIDDIKSKTFFLE